jgi:hypothetical protein
MSEILVDRNLLRRLLTDYFDIQIRDRASRALLSRGTIRNPDVGLQYGRGLQEEVARQQEQGAGFRSQLLKRLDEQDDEAFSRLLSHLPLPD